MPVIVLFHIVVLEIERAQLLHVDHAEIGRDAWLAVDKIAASRNALPRLRRKLRDGEIRLTAQHYIASRLAQCRGRGGRTMRSNGNFDGGSSQSSEPLRGHTQLWWRAAPE